MRQAWAIALAACMAACGGAGADRSADASLLPADAVLQPGDLAFRMGHGAESHAVCAVDPQGLYSHVGIAVATDSGIMIAHAVPGEYDFDGDVDRVRVDRPERFFGSMRAARGEVLRCADAELASRAAAIAITAVNVPFDHNYDDADTTALYCCELVEWAYSRAGEGLAQGPRHKIGLPGLKCSCMLPSDFFGNAKLKSVTKF